MKFCHVIKLSTARIAIADLSDLGSEGIYITRINVPENYRGKGYGTALLKMVLEEADKEHIELKLEVLASGGLSKTQLQKWYKRYGFVRTKVGTFIRKAK